MSVALFQSVLKTNEGETVWGSLKQKIVEDAEVPEHLAAGWLQSARKAIEEHELAKLETSNAALEAQIAAEQVKLDGRTAAAKALKAKSGTTTLMLDPAAPSLDLSTQPSATVTTGGNGEPLIVSPVENSGTAEQS